MLSGAKHLWLYDVCAISGIIRDSSLCSEWHMSRPDILFIMTDQQRFDTIAALENTHIYTPNMDRLVRKGMISNNASPSSRLKSQFVGWRRRRRIFSGTRGGISVHNSSPNSWQS